MLVATIGLSLGLSFGWLVGALLVFLTKFGALSKQSFLETSKISFKNMIFAFSVPSHVFCSDGNKSYLIQFAGPTIKIFLSVPLPLVSSLLATIKATAFAFFPWTSRAQRHHLPEHSSTQFFRVSQMIWNRFFCCFWMLLATFSIFHAICWDIFFWIFLPFSKLFLCFGQFFFSFDVIS